MNPFTEPVPGNQDVEWPKEGLTGALREYQAERLFQGLGN